MSTLRDKSVSAAGLKIEKSQGFVTLTLSRPDASNSISRDLMGELLAAFRDAEADPSNCAVVLTGEGSRSFCSGADLKSINVLNFDPNTSTAPFADLMRGVRALNVPLVARVNGSAVAGGVGLLGLCDFVIASSEAKFGISEIDVGFFPSMVVGALQRRLRGLDLISLCMLGGMISANAAKEIGLLSVVVSPDELDRAVSEVVQRLTRKPPMPLRRGKYMLRAIESMSFEESLSFTETMLRLQATYPEAAEGLAAFRDKRTPKWS